MHALELVADRFVAVNDGWIDLASGSPVRLRVLAARAPRDQSAWNEACGTLATLRHPLLNVLVDFGHAGREQLFEAYRVGRAVRAGAARQSLLLTHAVRFLAAHQVELTAGLVDALLRETVPPRTRGPTRRTRPLGVILQPRTVLDRIVEVLDEGVAGGPGVITIAGAPGSGLRTLEVLAARAARLAGYVPVASGLLQRMPRLQECIAGRTVCILVHEREDAPHAILASLLARLGTSSTRRHIVLKFRRGVERTAGALEMDHMTVRGLTSMIYVDKDCGPVVAELSSAARLADGRPALFLERLGAARFDEHHVRIAMVHESPPAYAVQHAHARPRPRGPGIGRALVDVPARARRLASRGRHASALRLLTRAGRVLGARGEHVLAAACDEALGWIERNRGRSDRALEAFERARDRGDRHIAAVSAAIGIGVVWTDMERFTEAEAALRAACAAADLVDERCVAGRARRALARCLFWQSRYDEALVHVRIDLADDGPRADREATVESSSLAARSRVCIGDLRGAIAAASKAIRAAEECQDPRARARAARSMAIVQAELGDAEQARSWVERGLRAASAAHLPILGLRLRVLRAKHEDGECASGRSVSIDRFRGALRDRLLPPLVRREIRRAFDEQPDGRGRPQARPDFDERALRDLQALLELAHAAPDEQAALDGLCRALCDQMRAATVQVVARGSDGRLLARAGRPWAGDARVTHRALAGATASMVAEAPEPRQWAEAIRYAHEPVAALSSRWMTGTGVDMRRVVALMRAGALAAAAPVRSLLDRAQAPPAAIAGTDLIGTSPAANTLREAIARAARAPFPVLVEGESGSGKELVARGIHRASARRDRKLCTINCAALSDELLEAELFGHARGAFTGAVGERPGLFEEADGGTLFLDEVGELSSRAQAKLLRVLQDGEVRRVGENLPRRVDTRIVAATNRHLDEEVAAGRFRADLRFRLDVIRILVPPLRERATDIPSLALHFWTEAIARLGSAATLTPETLAALARYDWPGNVRELQNAVAAIAVHAPRRGRVVPAMLAPRIASCGASATSSNGQTFEAAREEFERRYVRAALAQAGGQRSRAARALGVSRQGLAKMLSRLRIDDGRT